MITSVIWVELWDTVTPAKAGSQKAIAVHLRGGKKLRYLKNVPAWGGVCIWWLTANLMELAGH